MGWQSGAGGGTGDEPSPGVPGGRQAPDALAGSASSGDASRDPHLDGFARGTNGFTRDRDADTCASSRAFAPVRGASSDPLLSGFARGGRWDTCPPSAALAAALEAASGPEWRCPGASRDEMTGLLRQWQALESWAVAGKLGVLRALIREDDQPLPNGSYHGDLPEGWTKSLTHQVALALAMPPQSAEKMMWTAWDLEALLPGIGDLLVNGTLTYAKARAVDDALGVLTDDDAAKAEAMIMPDLAGKTYGQAERLAVQAAITVDPESATRRREDAERNRARVILRRDPSGAASLAGYDLPTDETLAGHANVCARAAQYKESGAFAGVRMDQFRAMAYLDILNGITAEARIGCGQPPAGLGAPNDYGHDSDSDDSDINGQGGAGSQDDGPDGEGPQGDDPDGGSHGGDWCSPDSSPRGPGSAGDCSGQGWDGGWPVRYGRDSGRDHSDPGTSDPGHGGGRQPDASGTNVASRVGTADQPRLSDLVLPLATLLGLAERPGEGHGLGPLDPDLCRALAATAANSPHTTMCVTVTDPDGIAIGHGCARIARRERQPGPAKCGSASPGPAPGSASRSGSGSAGAAAALPARLNLTITGARLAELAATPGATAAPAIPDATRTPAAPGVTETPPATTATGATETPGATGATGPPGRAAWTFIRDGDAGPPDDYGTWTLTLPDGRNLTTRLRAVPTFECDHRYESNAYQPNDTLRHLVQIRDGDCTFPTCSRHARESDFEHAWPYDKGGRTCACNAGARSRSCHQVKQSPGWNVTQPRPGWHQWTTPAGRTYTQGPNRYPALPASRVTGKASRGKGVTAARDEPQAPAPPPRFKSARDPIIIVLRAHVTSLQAEILR